MLRRFDLTLYAGIGGATLFFFSIAPFVALFIADCSFGWGNLSSVAQFLWEVIVIYSEKLVIISPAISFVLVGIVVAVKAIPMFVDCLRASLQSGRQLPWHCRQCQPASGLCLSEWSTSFGFLAE